MASAFPSIHPAGSISRNRQNVHFVYFVHLCYSLCMRSVSATEAKQNFAAVLDSAQRGPVVIRRHDRDVAAIVSMQDLERIRKIHVEEFLQLSARIGKAAAARGMNEEVLARLLADDDSESPRNRR